MLVKWWFDRNYVWNKEIEVGDLVLKWDKLNEAKGRKLNFQHLWLDPC